MLCFGFLCPESLASSCLGSCLYLYYLLDSMSHNQGADMDYPHTHGGRVALAWPSARALLVFQWCLGVATAQCPAAGDVGAPIWASSSGFRRHWISKQPEFLELIWAVSLSGRISSSSVFLQTNSWGGWDLGGNRSLEVRNATVNMLQFPMGLHRPGILRSDLDGEAEGRSVLRASGG